MNAFARFSAVPLLFFCLPAQAQNVEAGRMLFERSCAGCHGANGDGGGEISKILSVETPDLTKLSANNDGQFPMLSVIHVIDGRTGVRGHGGTMPVFGAIYTQSSATQGEDYGSIIEVHGRILSLALFLESIQK